MKQLTQRHLFRASLVLGASLLTACEGESRPFEEAAEVQALGVIGLNVLPPEQEDPTSVVINRNQSLQMRITGQTVAGTAVQLDSGDRVWESNNPESVIIDNNGVISGVADGNAVVTVTIGGIKGQLPVTVSDAALTSIVSIDGVTDIERCLPQQYFATGAFGSSNRPLYDVTFSLKEGSAATLKPVDGGGTVVNVTSLAGATLVASAPNVADKEQPLTVLNTLSSIAISPTMASIAADAQVDLEATGNYSENSVPVVPDTDMQPQTPTVVPVTGKTEDTVITNNLEWTISSGPNFAEVGNTEADKGLVRGKAEGTATVIASCGELQSEGVTVSVTAASAANSTELQFDLDTPVSIALGDERQFKITRGSSFANGTSVAPADVSFAVSPGDIVDLDELKEGNIVGLTAGTTTITVTLAETGNSPEATGNFTVTVTAATL